MRAPRWGMGVALMVAGAVSPAAAQSDDPPPMVLGYRVRVVASGAPELAGEFIGLGGDSLWVLTAAELTGLPLGDVRKITVRRHGMSGGKVFGYAMIGGAVTGLLLTGACASVEDASCGGVLPAFLLLWGVVGGLSALSVEPSSRRELRPPYDPGTVGRYARFPAGLPPGPRRELGLRLTAGLRIPLP